MAIRRLNPPILDDDDGRGNLICRIPLSSKPDRSWIDAFDAGPLIGSLNVPHIDLDEIVVTVPRGLLDAHLTNIDARIAYANSLGP